MEKYYFVTNWFFLAPIERVWSELTNVKSWPEWWQEFKRVTMNEPDSKRGRWNPNLVELR